MLFRSFRRSDVEVSAAAIRRALLGVADSAQMVVEQNSFARRVREAAEHAASNHEDPRVHEFAGGRVRLVVTVREVFVELVEEESGV